MWDETSIRYQIAPSSRYFNIFLLQYFPQVHPGGTGKDNMPIRCKKVIALNEYGNCQKNDLDLYSALN